MTRPWHAFAALLAGSSAGAAVFAAGIYGMMLLAADVECANQIVAEHRFPDGRLKVLEFVRDCGATTGYAKMASLRGADEVLSDADPNLFAADTNHGSAPNFTLEIEWQGPKKVIVRHHPNLRVFKAETSVSGVMVEYRERESETRRREWIHNNVPPVPLE